MKKIEISSVLRTFLSFARKAIRWLQGTSISRERYLELLASELSAFAAATTKQLLLVNLPPRHLKTLLGSECVGICRQNDQKQPLLVNDANNESSQTDLQQSRSKNDEEK